MSDNTPTTRGTDAGGPREAAGSTAPSELPSYDEVLHQLHYASVYLRKIRDEHPEHDSARLAGVALCQVRDSRTIAHWIAVRARP